MKILLLLMAVLPSLAYAQASDVAYWIDKEPAGTLPVNSQLYIDQGPVTNAMFQAYLDYFDKNTSNTSKSRVFSPTAFNSRLDYKTYSTHPRYADLPVLRRSYADAQNYCRWRTVMVNLRYGLTSNTRDHQRLYKKIIFRLPTYDELILASITYYRKKRIQETREPNPLAIDKNDYSLSDLRFHNISEMTSDGRLYGSNWKREFSKNQQTDYIGFRCVCEIEK